MSGACRIDTMTDFRDPEGNSLGDAYNYQPENYLVTPQSRYNVYSAGSYKLTDRTNAFFEATYMNRKSDQRLAPTPLFTISEGIGVDANNLYNPYGRDFFDVRRRMVEAGPRRFRQDLDTFRLVTGFEGKLSKDLEFLKGWRWDLSYNYGRTAGKQINEGRFVRSRVINALGATNPDGSCVNDPENCVPLNLLGGVGTITPEMLDYISYTGISDGFNEMKSWTFNTSGRLMKTPWGGDVALATGLEYRSEAGSFIPDPITESGDTTGNKGEATAGSFDVAAAYAELSIVPVIGKPYAEWLEFNLATRTSSFSTFGTATTYKGGGLWRHKSGVSLRGTYSTAFRAPSIGSLYSGQNDSFPSVTDPCDTSQAPRSPNEEANCSADGIPDDFADNRAQLRALIGGNPDLDPETAKIMTLGAVYEPTFAPGLSFTVDFFNIAVDQAIATKGSTLILENCYDRPPEERSDCDLIQRDASGLITNISDTLTNIGGNDTSGVDLTVRYDHNTKVGRFRHNLEGTWLRQYNAILADGTVVVGKGVYDLGVYPAWRFNFSSMWSKGAMGAGLNVRYIHSFRECEDNNCKVGQELDEDLNPEPFSRPVSANVTGDLFANYMIKSELGNTRLSVGMNNVLNQNPAVIYNGFLATSDASTYDFLGRYVYARLVQQF
jgi:outer membrane receptor protein involved in Fe transport